MNDIQESPLKSFKNFISTKAAKKEYDAALDMVKKGYKVADAAKMFKHVDARTLQKMTEENLEEKLSVADGQKAWIDDFLDSDAPQFKGKSKDEKIKMAIAAFKQAEDEMNEEKEPASPDEASMAIRQAEFIEYVGREIKEHLENNKDFPEWMQNKLSGLHEKAKDMHSTLGAHGEEESLEESRIETSRKFDEFKKSILRDYPHAEFRTKGEVTQAYVDMKKYGVGSTQVNVGEYYNKDKRGFKYDKPNVKGNLKEEAPANSVAAGGVDMNPTGYTKKDKRKKESTESMYRRATGLDTIKRVQRILAKYNNKA